VQQNTAEARQARSKKSSRRESRQPSTGKSRKSSKSATRKQSSHASDRDDSDFIKDIVAPLKAKTKNELLGKDEEADPYRTDKSRKSTPRSRRSSKGRSQDKS